VSVYFNVDHPVEMRGQEEERGNCWLSMIFWPAWEMDEGNKLWWQCCEEEEEVEEEAGGASAGLKFDEIFRGGS
jgi:hypothetical protein